MRRGWSRRAVLRGAQYRADERRRRFAAIRIAGAAAISSLTPPPIEYAIGTSNESYGEPAKSARRTATEHKRVLHRAGQLDLAHGCRYSSSNVCHGRQSGDASSGVALLNSKVLILNRSYLPVHVTSVKRAFALLYQGVARAVDEQYHTFDFASWRDLAIETHHERLGVVGGSFACRECCC